MKTLFSLCLLFTLSFTYARAQVTPATSPDYCSTDSKVTLAFIGKHAKIANAGGVYSTLNDSEAQTWPTPEMKKLGGRSGWKKYIPATGDTGIIVHVFPGKGGTAKPIYLLKIGDKYVPVGCRYIVVMP